MTRNAQAVAALALALTMTLISPADARAGIHVKLGPDSSLVQPGDTVTVQLQVYQADSQFNAFDAFIRFDPSRLQFVPASSISQQIGPVMSSACGSFFHQFIPRSDTLEIHLSLLCKNVFVTGPGVIYQVRFRVLDGAGPTEIYLGSGTEFYAAGFFVRPVETLPMELYEGGTASVGSPSNSGTPLQLSTPRPNPYRGEGPATMRFTLPGPDRVGFAVLDTQGRRVAARAPEDFEAGSHAIAWSGLRLAPGHYVVKMSSAAGLRAARSWVVVR